MNKFRTGLRKLGRPLNYTLERKLDQHATRMLGGVPRPRAPNYLSEACQALKAYLRQAKRMAKRDPHLFDWAFIQRQRREAEARRKWNEEVEQAVARVYGPDAALEKIEQSSK